MSVLMEAGPGLGALRPVVLCPGTGAGGRRCLARLLATGAEDGVLGRSWRAVIGLGPGSGTVSLGLLAGGVLMVRMPGGA